MATVSIIATISPAQENQAAALRAFTELAAIVQSKESQCLAFQVFFTEGEITIYKRYTNMDAWNFHRNSAWTRKALADGKTEPVIKVLTGQVVGYDGGLGLALAPVVAEEAGLAVEELKPMSVVAASA